tara:strand:+ start:421 stop:807 length:387 start_codon:yes stop_codon:yes gene_type:complete
MGKNGRGSTDLVANVVLNLCRETDGGAMLTYVGVGDDGETVVRVAAGVASSASALQRALAASLPLAKVRTSESVLDGALMAVVTIPSMAAEWTEAVHAVCGRKLFVLLRTSAVAALLLGLGSLASSTD